MKTEVQKDFKQGFVLTEDELRRLVDCATQAMKRVLSSDDFTTRIHAKFKNGTIAECGGVEDLLGFDNSGATQIVGMHLHLSEKGGTGRHQIVTDFDNVMENKRQDTSVELRVRGDDRDWVHITSSQIEERITKVRTPSIHRFWSRYGVSFLMPMCMTLFILTSVIGIILSKPTKSAAADALEAAIRDNSVSDPVRAILLVERVKATEYSAESYRMIRNSLIIPVFAVVTLLLILFSVQYLFPSYVFYWSDAIKIYDRRLAARRYVLIAVITGVLVSVLGGLVVSRISLSH